MALFGNGSLCFIVVAVVLDICDARRMHLDDYLSDKINNATDTYTRNDHQNGYVVKTADFLCGELFCTCSGDRAECIFLGYHLRYVPKLPRFITELKFSGNELSVINAATLRNISDLELQKLNFANNSVINISKDAFKNMNFLTHLDLGENKGLNPSQVADALFSLNTTTITSVILIDMGCTSLPDNMFQALFRSKLAHINLSLNNLKTFRSEMFSKLRFLTEINLAGNVLDRTEIDTTLSSLKFLDFPGNSLSTIPDFCNKKRQKSFVPKLEDLDMDANRIRELKNGLFKCLTKLVKLSLRNNPIRVIADNFLLPLKSLEILHLSEINLPAFNDVKITKYAFNSSSLKRLYFIGNKLTLGFYDPMYMFKNCKNLEYLILSHTVLPDDDLILRHLLSPLTRLTVLRLDNTELSIIPEVISSKLTSLIELSLARNKIGFWNGSKIFEKMVLLRLYLNGNQISVINETSFPDLMLRFLSMLHLGDNPFSCTCSTADSVQWFRKHTDIVINYPNQYKCDSPSDIKGILLEDYNPSPESCKEKDIVLLVTLPIYIVSIATMAAIFTVYKCRWRLRYGIYTLRRRYKDYEMIDHSDDFVYAGFVIYSDADRTWVHNELIHRIEDQEGFRLCVRLRDFEVGKVHVDNIVENMMLSEKIIIVLSNNFARDEWCHFQLLLAETRLLQNNIDNLVLFMLDEINSKCLRPSLYKLVRHKQFALWSNDETGNTLFWDQAISQLTRSNNIDL